MQFIQNVWLSAHSCWHIFFCSTSILCNWHTCLFPHWTFYIGKFHENDRWQLKSLNVNDESTFNVNHQLIVTEKSIKNHQMHSSINGMQLKKKVLERVSINGNQFIIWRLYVEHVPEILFKHNYWHKLTLSRALWACRVLIEIFNLPFPTVLLKLLSNSQ